MARGFAPVYIAVLRGTPVLMLLLLFYYRRLRPGGPGLHDGIPRRPRLPERYNHAVILSILLMISSPGVCMYYFVNGKLKSVS